MYIHLWLFLFQVHRTCADVFFSGHASNLTLMALIWHSSSHKKGTSLTTMDPYGDIFCSGIPLHTSDYKSTLRCSFAKILVWTAAITGYVIIIATRFHYTLDVLLGIFLTCLVWSLYHHYLDGSRARPNGFNRLLVWLESDDPESTDDAGVNQRLVHGGSPSQAPNMSYTSPQPPVELNIV